MDNKSCDLTGSQKLRDWRFSSYWRAKDAGNPDDRSTEAQPELPHHFCIPGQAVASWEPAVLVGGMGEFLTSKPSQTWQLQFSMWLYGWDPCPQIESAIEFSPYNFILLCIGFVKQWKKLVLQSLYFNLHIHVLYSYYKMLWINSGHSKNFYSKHRYMFFFWVILEKCHNLCFWKIYKEISFMFLCRRLFFLTST